MDWSWKPASRKTGGTAYRCDTVVTLVDEGLSLSASAVNALRRDALAALTAARTAPPKRRELPVPPCRRPTAQREAPRLTISVTRLEQLSPPCWSWAARPGSISRWKRSPGWNLSREKARSGAPFCPGSGGTGTSLRSAPCWSGPGLWALPVF